MIRIILIIAFLLLFVSLAKGFNYIDIKSFIGKEVSIMIDNGKFGESSLIGTVLEVGKKYRNNIEVDVVYVMTRCSVEYVYIDSIFYIKEIEKKEK
jgi:hypothetical protein